MVKYSPVLRKYKNRKHNPWESFTANGVWLCAEKTDKNWTIQGKKIWIAGSTEYVEGAIEQRAGRFGHWMNTQGGITVRYYAFARFLESFNAPVVWVWIEEWVE